ncbi:RNA-guided endonuclease TnpB family protein [Dactylosporangium sp. CA-233914]|uniref:RNA-guided endonuclease TnpB family protein n=1 Tax=Dactylosporangium sp. CA-233914 TaxID=3239934 RepID=UPI003D8E55C1
MVYRTTRVGLRLTRLQRQRCFGLLRSAGDVWSCVLELNGWRRRRGDAPLASIRELFGELAAAGPGTFGELDSVGARSVLHRFSDAWFAAAKRRKAGDGSARFPRRRRGLVPVRWYYGTFRLDGRRLRLPVAVGKPSLWLRLDRAIPYPAGQVRSVTLLADGGRVWLEVTAEVPITTYPPGVGPDPGRVAGVDLGIIHPYAVAGPDGHGLLVSGRAVRAEHRMHLADTKARQRAVAKRAPKPGQKGSRRWRQSRHRTRLVEGRHRRRIRQAHHEAAKTVIAWAVQQRVGTLTVGDPRGVLSLDAGRRHNLRLRQWQLGRAIAILRDKAELAGITLQLVDERGSSSTCPACRARVRKPAGRTMTCTTCHTIGHRDLFAAATIATRTPTGADSGGITTTAVAVLPRVVTHRRAGRHLPGAGPSRRDPRRPHHVAAAGSVGRLRPAPPPTPVAGSRSPAPHGEEPQTPPPRRERLWSQHYVLPVEEESLSELFWSVARRLRHQSHEALQPWGITPGQARALGVVAKHGTMRPSELSEHLRIAPRSTTEVVDGLQSRGLVERLPDPADRRATLVALTASGAATAQSIKAERGAQGERFFAALPQRDRAELARILAALRVSDPA